jgi:hypothetical protein
MRLTRLAKRCIPLILVLFFLNGVHGLAQSGMDVAVHYVEGVPAEDGGSYTVTAYVSVMDGLGFPIRDLPREAFWLTEDSQDAGIQNAKVVESEPINLILAIDTSEGLSGLGNNDIKPALKTFLTTLKPNDPVAILTFDETIKDQISFGIDRIASADFIDLIPSYIEAGTCVFDTAYSAIQMASKLNTGNRAVILFTDGVDQTATGAICSLHTADDVINLASSGGTRAPVSIVELGGAEDNMILKRIADVTGGLYLHAFSPRDLNTLTQQLSDDLKSQYILNYQSFSGAGAHTLRVEVDQSGVQASDTRNFVLPPPPTRIAFLTLQEGDTIGSSLQAEASLVSQGETVNRVAFEINGTVVDTDDAKPYELNLDLGSYPAGMITVSAVAYGANDKELTSTTINLMHSIDAIEPTTIAPTPALASPPGNILGTIRPVMVLGVVLGGLGIFTIVLLISVLVHQQQKEKATEEEEVGNNLFGPPPSPGIAAVSDVYRTEKVKKRESAKPDLYGTLLVEASDDASLVGHLFHIISETTTIGRSADNDIPFPKDNPVSRQHAEIFFKEGRLYLKEIQSHGTAGESKPPKYGTFIDQRRVGADPVQLRTGSEIGLGKRVRLKFEAGGKLSTLDTSTHDDMTTDGEDEDFDRTVTHGEDDDFDNTVIQ